MGQQVNSAISMGMWSSFIAAYLQPLTLYTLAKSLWIGVAPLFGAFVADQYLGRYRTLQWANVVTIVAHVVLIVAASPRVITQSSASLVLYLLGVILLGVGFGGIK